jgi:hypothetical protein
MIQRMFDAVQSGDCDEQTVDVKGLAISVYRCGGVIRIDIKEG